ncbi:MAG: hypothetical protein U1D28_06155 [Burkholderiales bacterium]|nr:hypothetical protein [Burkholderiales bacterium]
MNVEGADWWVPLLALLAIVLPLLLAWWLVVRRPDDNRSGRRSRPEK